MQYNFIPKICFEEWARYQSKLQGTDFCILGSFTSSQLSLSAAKGYNTTTNLQADHSAAHTPRAMITCIHAWGK